MSDEPLKPIARRIFQARGASYEGDICSALKPSPFVVRASEFGLADFAVDCTKTYAPTDSWLDRYWDVYDRRYEDPSQLLLGEAKSSVGIAAGEQMYKTTFRQRRHVAFYIGINAADPQFVDVIPNYDQEPAALDEEGTAFTSDNAGGQAASVATARESTLPPVAYGRIDQCLAPYRMPIWLLLEAIRRIRECYRTGAPYQNPWTRVTFADWKPRATRQTKFLRPGDDADQASAHEAVMEIYRTFKFDGRSRFRVDMVGLQPSLADFKFVWKHSDGGSQEEHQVFVQHKLDDTLRAQGAAVRKVYICRGDGTDRRWYFTAFERFDFLWLQFSFSRGALGEQNEFFLIPETEIPDEFYTTEERAVSFEAFPHLEQFRTVLDGDGEWIAWVERIVRAYPSPRRAGNRPVRESTMQTIRAGTILSGDREPPNVPAALSAVPAGPTQGRRLFAHMVSLRHREFFFKLMEVCATFGSGLLFVLARSHNWGDFGFCRYDWSQAEQTRFLADAVPPKAAHQLPPDTEAVMLSYFTQHSEATFVGPNVRPRHFRRLDASDIGRLTIWDLGGPDTKVPALRAAAIPSEDIVPSKGQRNIFARNLVANNGQRRFEDKNPNLSAMLTTGLLAGEYGVGSGGPLAYDEPSMNSWVDMWKLLDRFTQVAPLEHPRGCIRYPEAYRQTLQSVHQRLQQQYRTGEDVGDDDY